jgi:hypothetical protein
MSGRTKGFGVQCSATVAPLPALFHGTSWRAKEFWANLSAVNGYKGSLTIWDY